MASDKPHRLTTVACIGKGGAGKSTITTNLAVIARRAGLRSAIIDADPQASSSVWKRLRDRNDIPVVRCDPLTLDRAIEAARRAGIDLVFIDMAPGLHHVPEAAQRADLVLIPARPTLFDLRVTSDLIPILNSAACRYAVILNGAPPVRELGEAPMARQARDALDSIGPRLWRRQITARVAIPNASVRGKGVVETEPKGHAAFEFSLLWAAVKKALNLKGPAYEVSLQK
jgi:chromosome partitioning protein